MTNDRGERRKLNSEKFSHIYPAPTYWSDKFRYDEMGETCSINWGINVF
jgi:hypothetical protein